MKKTKAISHSSLVCANSCLNFHLLSESGRFSQQRMTERKQCEKPECEARRKTPMLNQSAQRKTMEGEAIGSLSNNLVYTKRQKDIYPNRRLLTSAKFLNL